MNRRAAEPQRVIGIIPARLAAVRLPNKPLLDIAGKPMIQWVWEQAKKVTLLDDLLVATPDEAILQAVEAFGGCAVVTSHAHRSGTDRLAEAAANLDADIIVNIQGDEPLLDPRTIEKAIGPLLADLELPMVSLMCPCPPEERDNPATVKVVCDCHQNALYFSRARIPHPRNEEAVPVMQHIGLYAYRREFLLTYAQMEPTPLEKTEGLEQLRVLENGYTIRMVAVEQAPLSVDTPDDLRRVREIFAARLGGQREQGV